MPIDASKIGLRCLDITSALRRQNVTPTMGRIVTEAKCSIFGTAAQGSNRSPFNNCLPPTKMLRRSARPSDPDGRLSSSKRPFTDACSTASKVITISHRAQASSYSPSWLSRHTKPAWGTTSTHAHANTRSIAFETRSQTVVVGRNSKRCIKFHPVAFYEKDTRTETQRSPCVRRTNGVQRSPRPLIVTG